MLAIVLWQGGVDVPDEKSQTNTVFNRSPKIEISENVYTKSDDGSGSSPDASMPS